MTFSSPTYRIRHIYDNMAHVWCEVIPVLKKTIEFILAQSTGAVEYTDCISAEG